MKKLKLATVIGIIFVLITGSLAHFVYEWSGNNALKGLFTPVNESVWEHMKLVFFPMLLYSVWMISGFRKKYPCVISALCLGITAGTLLIPVFFYAYTGLLGRDFFVLDIAAFVLSVLAAFLLSYRLTLSCGAKPYTFFLCVLVCILFVCFMRFTYHAPALGIFSVPEP